VTQRLQRIVVVRAIHGARGARHFNNIVRPSIHFAAGTRTGGTQVLTVRHRNVSTPSNPIALPGHTLMQRLHPLQAMASSPAAMVLYCRDPRASRPVTTPLSNSRGPKRGEMRMLFSPIDPNPPAAATCFSRTTPCTLPPAILTGRYSGTGRAGTCSVLSWLASSTAVLSSASAIRSIIRVFSFGSTRYTGTGTSFPNTITDRAAGKNCNTRYLSSSERLSRLTSVKTSIPCSGKNNVRFKLLFLSDCNVSFRQGIVNGDYMSYIPFPFSCPKLRMYDCIQSFPQIISGFFWYFL
jgi:hypothetical protein